MDEDRDAYLDEVLIGGREPAAITLVDYDEQWSRRFKEAAERIRRVLGKEALSIEHIGSTSVPGLVAKPIIDVLVTVTELMAEGTYIPALESTGFVLRVNEAGHWMLRTPVRDVHVHVYEPDRPEVLDHLALRDWLRVDADDRMLYAETKQRLAQYQWTDMNDYADAKTPVIREILTRARRRRAAQDGR